MWRSSWQQDIQFKEYCKAAAIVLLVLFIISYLFFNSNWVFTLSVPLLIPYIKTWEKSKENQMKQEFMSQFKEFLLALATAISAGYAVENAVVEARVDLQRQFSTRSRLIVDLLKMEQLMKMNIPITDI